MPRYTLEELLDLRESPLVKRPDFEWHEFEAIVRKRRSSSHKQRPVVMPQAVLPRTGVFNTSKTNSAGMGNSDIEDDDADPPETDEEMAARILQQREWSNKQMKEHSHHHHHPGGPQLVNLGYAAALAATSTIGRTEESPDQAVADDDGDWISVGHEKTNRKKSFGRNGRGSFSRWR